MIPAVLCPGTYDPITCGHTAIISRAAAIFGHATVVVMNNSEKRTMFSADRRLEMAKAAFEGRTDVDVCLCGGLLADYALSLGGAVIVKGVRDGADFSYEMNIAQINRSLGGVETLLLPSDGGTSFISSTFVRDLIIYGRSTEGYVPAAVGELISRYHGHEPGR